MQDEKKSAERGSGRNAAGDCRHWLRRRGDPKETLTVFNYGEYMDPIVLDMFEDETGIEVKYEEALTPEEMYIQVCVRRGGL